MLSGSGAGYFKPGQYGTVVAKNTAGGMHYTDVSRVSKPGEVALLVSKGGNGGALWFTENAVRYTKPRKPRKA